jgi:hypothetical protein
MFRRLAELQQKENRLQYRDGNRNESRENFTSPEHAQFLQYQNNFYNTLLPNIMPTASSQNAPNSYYQAVQSPSLVSPNSLPVQTNINSVFYPNTIPQSLVQQQQVCQTSSIDSLIATKNPMAPIGCGWLYSPPTTGSPIPTLSQGTIGTAQGSIKPS